MNGYNKTLFIDARHLGFMADRTHKEFSKDDIKKNFKLHSMPGAVQMNKSTLIELGFCKEATVEEVRNNNHILHPELCRFSRTRR